MTYPQNRFSSKINFGLANDDIYGVMSGHGIGKCQTESPPIMWRAQRKTFWNF